MMIVMMVTTGTKIEKIEAVERGIIVGEENVVGKRVKWTMMRIVMMITTGMVRKMIVEENIAEEKAARIVG